MTQALDVCCEHPVGRGRRLGRALLTLAVAGLLYGCATQPAAPPPAAVMAPSYDIDAHIAEASARFDIPEIWIREVMMVESSGRTHFSDGRPIVSHAGAMGLMQVMPGTWAELAARHGFGNNPHDPRENVLAGTAYLREMYDIFGYPGFLAAYNAGPGRYRQHIADGRPLPRETTRYMSLLIPRTYHARPAQSIHPRPSQLAAHGS